MKIERLVLYVALIIISVFSVIVFYDTKKPIEQDKIAKKEEVSINHNSVITGVAISKLENPTEKSIIQKVSTVVTGEAFAIKEIKIVEKVYNDMTMEELEAKLNRSLNSTLSNTGNLFAKYSIKYGVDPYLAVAIALHETGCKWECSTLVKQCNNVGGQKGSPGCGGGTYKSFATLEEGIHGFIYNIYNNYYKHGLNTPELMNSKYAESRTWSKKVNNYIVSIKNS